MAKHNIGAKHFFTIIALSCTLLVMFFVTGVIQVPTRISSDASGVSNVSLNDCTRLQIDRMLAYGGGVKLFNGDGYTGGDRVLCAPFFGFDNKTYEFADNLNKKDISNANAYNDIWGNFQGDVGNPPNNAQGAESLKLRALGGCLVKVKLYSEYNAPDYALIDTYEINRIGSTTHTKSVELPNSQDNKAKSIKLGIRCNK